MHCYSFNHVELKVTICDDPPFIENPELRNIMQLVCLGKCFIDAKLISGLRLC